MDSSIKDLYVKLSKYKVCDFVIGELYFFSRAGADALLTRQKYYTRDLIEKPLLYVGNIKFHYKFYFNSMIVYLNSSYNVPVYQYCKEAIAIHQKIEYNF